MNRAFTRNVLSDGGANARTPKSTKTPLSHYFALGIILGLTCHTAQGAGVEIVDANQKLGVPIGKYSKMGAKQLQGGYTIRLVVADASTPPKPFLGIVTIKNINLWPPPGFDILIPQDPKKFVATQKSCDDLTRVIKSRAEFQQDKAKVWAAALNANAKIKAAYATYNPPKMVVVNPPFNVVDPAIADNTYTQCNNAGVQLPAGQWVDLTIPRVPKLPNGQKLIQEVPANDAIVPAGEGGDGFGFVKPPPTDTGTTGSLGRDPSEGATVAKGFDLSGAPSFVEVGIKEEFVAVVTPTAGMTDAEVLLALEASLLEHGIPASFDPLGVTLEVDVPPGKTFEWGNTDSSLEFDAAVESRPEYNLVHVLLQATCANYTVSADSANAGGTVFSSGTLNYTIAATPSSGAPPTMINGSIYPVNTDANGNFSVTVTQPLGQLSGGTFSLTGSVTLTTSTFTSQISLFPPTSFSCGPG